MPEVQDRPVTLPARWARSPLDSCVHLLVPEGDHPQAALKARCGHLLLAMAHRHDQPPSGLPCERCRLIFIADHAAGPCPAASDPGSRADLIEKL